ncbi:MAG TPA: deoxyribose-phosphate aldolase [Micavibrio sp.]
MISSDSKKPPREMQYVGTVTGGGAPQAALPAVIHDPHAIARNPGMPLDLSIVNQVRVNTNGVQARAAEFGARRTVKKDFQAAWVLKAVTLMDLTTLSGDDTYGKVDRLCAKAKNPIDTKFLRALGMADKNITTGAVCVYHGHVKEAVDFLKGTHIPVAAVSTGFPHGQSPFKTRLDEIFASVADGAKEIDIVITRELALTGQWERLYDEMKAYREACGDAHVKAILGTGDLGTLENVAKASWVCMMAGADFIKTSTGKEGVNANLAVSLTMVRALRDYYDLSGYKIGYKPAGGISSAKDALENLYLIKEELGNEWMRPELFRFGASSLLNDIERQIEHHVTGKYSAGYRHGMA